MSSSNYFRSWIDRPHLDPNTRLLTEEYQRGITEFMGLVHRQPEAKTGLRSSEIPDENSEEHLVGTFEDWTIGKSIEISRGSSPSVYSEDLSDELVVLGIPSEISEGFPRKNEFPRSYFRGLVSSVCRRNNVIPTTYRQFFPSVIRSSFGKNPSPLLVSHHYQLDWWSGFLHVLAAHSEGSFSVVQSWFIIFLPSLCIPISFDVSMVATLRRPCMGRENKSQS
ncbi:hypothetical protein DY000_02061147 [Brassica cretica]|uniref:Uncharacterized protein n=1 Tax=Brassica cretica TaxID=69181 RepID=A0ABQ7B3J6_BRACR|nr:hypothetical protein DY000_02061147 [Brassica cretica]